MQVLHQARPKTQLPLALGCEPLLLRRLLALVYQKATAPLLTHGRLLTFAVAPYPQLRVKTGSRLRIRQARGKFAGNSSGPPVMNRWTLSRAHLLRLALGSAATTAAAGAISLAPGEAKAALTYNIFESGSDVVITTSGSLNLSSSIANNLKCAASGALLRQASLICTGTGNINMDKYNITLIGADGLFNNSIAQVLASSVSGTYSTTLSGSGGSPYFGTNAPSGTSNASTTTFTGTTLATLGFTTTGLIGTWTLNGSGDSIYVCVGSTYCGPPVPAPGPLPLLGAGAAFAWSRRLRQRIGTPRSGAPRG
jgi:hypothetical protein